MQAVLAQGKQLFTLNCAVCHRPERRRSDRPELVRRLLDSRPAFADNVHTIIEGVLAKGMISWKAVLKPDDILAVGSYIYSCAAAIRPIPRRRKA
jgi:cytochrome c oxidase cbb3-type subunit 3